MCIRNKNELIWCENEGNFVFIDLYRLNRRNGLYSMSIYTRHGKSLESIVLDENQLHDLAKKIEIELRR